MTSLIIAIDGPSGAGKGTVARAVSRALDYRHVDTGAMYRAIGWLARERGLDLSDEAAVAALAGAADLRLDHRGRVEVDGADVTHAIRNPGIDAAAAAVARLPAVRRILVDRQRALGAAGAVVMEGRDIGTVVFPSADVKIYLDAAPEERARRRASDPAHAGGPAGAADVALALEERDRLDTTRAASPLAAAPDARLIDTTGVPVETVVEQVLAIVREILGRRAGR